MTLDRFYTITEYLANRQKRTVSYRAIREVSRTELTNEFMKTDPAHRLYFDEDEKRWYLLEREPEGATRVSS